MQYLYFTNCQALVCIFMFGFVRATRHFKRFERHEFTIEASYSFTEM